MPRAKKRPTFIKSLRVDSETKQFLESLENANEFVLQLLQSTDDYQKFIKALREKENQNQPKLF
ncbi:hypothetical protein LS74_010615 [Helicobacter magdeburgensis]|uniref:Uncharacterized protein n=1 Tax=Helicobacter magdeburgensis TaxID=471858 RepID=A0A4U8SVT8_9HELI|nr:hypothetical protein [Helicobacter magdeburgensis]TLD91039.1 hypothetical protein LS74_010615 [Helicobacter magdeburgensis]